jgi:hypothetical protein
MSDVQGANPLGASDLDVAASKIGGILRSEPKGQPQESAAPEQANPAPERVRDQSGKFVRQAEPETEVAASETQPEVTAETTDDTEELPDRIEILAEKLGVDVDTFREHIKAPVKINGEERAVNLRELIAGYQKGEDYSRKTAEVAEQRKAIDAERAAYQQQRERIASELEPLVPRLAAQIENDQAAIQKAYEQGDYQEAVRLQYLSQTRQAELTKAQAAQQQIAQEKQREQYQEHVRFVEEQEKILLEAKPAWAKDPEKGKRELTNIRDYLKSLGVPPQNVDRMHEAVPLLLAEKAMLWDKLQKDTKPKALQEVKAKPKFQAPGAAKPTQDPQQQAVRANFNRLRKTGDVRDAAKVFKAMGLGK